MGEITLLTYKKGETCDWFIDTVGKDKLPIIKIEGIEDKKVIL